MMTIDVVYLDGVEETYNVPAGVLVQRTPDLIRIGNAEIERSTVRRITVTREEQP